MQDIKFKPYLQKYKTPVGALNSLEPLVLNIYIKKFYNFYTFEVVVVDEDMEILRRPMECIGSDEDYNIYTVTFSLVEPYIYWYYFEVTDCYGRHFIGRDESLNAKLYDSYVVGFQLNVCFPTNKNLSWYQGKVMYQIFMDRFFKGGDNPPKESGYNHLSWDEDVLYLPINGKHSNDFYGGDIQGVIAKLPYLKELNVGIIYFNPLFLAPSNHKYNTSDYLLIDPMFGTNEDFEKLCKEAKELGIEIILDGVFNHTGDDSIYFNKYNNFSEVGAYQSKDSKYYEWYNFIDYPDEYRSWWGIKTLPSINQNSSFVDFITGKNGVISTWMKKGIKGFRLDVVDELNDEFVQKINKAVATCDKDAIVIGEVWEDATNKISYGKRRTYFIGDQLDSVMNYVIKDAIINYLKNDNLHNLVYKLRETVNNYPQNVLNSLMNILSTHDTVRIITMFSNVDEFTLTDKDKASFVMDKVDFNNALKKTKMAFTILYTIFGVPCIYYGDEVGLEGYRDPFSRRPFPWKKGSQELLNHVKLLGKIRQENVFIDGKYLEVFYDNYVFVYKRVKKDKEYYVFINNSNTVFKYRLPSNATKIVDLFSGLSLNHEIIVEGQTSVIVKVDMKN